MKGWIANALDRYTSMKMGMLLLGMLAISAFVGMWMPAESFFYQSKLFYGLVSLLCLQMVVCTLRRLQTFSRDWRGLGLVLVHLSLPFIGLGAFLGNVYGFQYQTALPVGGVYQVGEGNVSIRLDSFETQYYPDGSVSDWISRVTLFQGDEKVATRSIKVNEPFTYQGIRMYQAFYGTGVHTRYESMGGQLLQQAEVMEGSLLPLNGPGNLAVEVVSCLLGAGRSGEPKVLYRLYQGGQMLDFGVVSLGQPILLPEHEGRVNFTESIPFSGLQIKKDPGLPLVWTGCSLLVVGIFLSLYSRPRSLQMVGKERREVS